MIKISNLSKSFGQVAAIKKVSLDVRTGQIFGLVGPDGAGKTTLMRMICGLIEPDEGEILLFEGLPPGEKVRDRIGYMPQRFSLYGDLTVRENIDFFGSLYGLKWDVINQRADEILEITRLKEFSHRLADNLSGGMKQKLVLTCALITRPALLILDEPTYGVDPQIRKEFWRILYRLNREGVTVMVSTPYMDEAELCHQVAIINEGQIAASDTPAVLRKTLPHRLIEVKAQTRDPEVFSGISEILETSFYGDRFHVAVEEPATVFPIITKLLEGKQIQLTSLREIEPSMEDVFVALTGKVGTRE